MISPLLTLYKLFRWLILLILFTTLLLFFFLESPATLLDLIKKPLEEQGISYGKIEGSLLSGFVLKEVNYQDKVQAKELSLTVDYNALKNRVLVVDNLVLRDAKIDKDFLKSLIENNSTTEENSTDTNTTLPFDRVLINRADISLQDIIYNEYAIHSVSLHIDNLDTDMKQKHKGKVYFNLDSNISKVDMHANFDDGQYNIKAKLEGEKKFIEPFVEKEKIKLLSNPLLNLELSGTMDELDYKLTLDRLDIQQDRYEIHSEKLITFGHYHIVKKDLINNTKGSLRTNVGYLTLDTESSLNLDDLNNTLLFDINGKFKPKRSHLLSSLEKEKIQIEQFPTIEILAKGDMKNVNFSTELKALKGSQENLSFYLKSLSLKGNVKPLAGDTTVVLQSDFDSSFADAIIDSNAKLNFNDINNTLYFEMKSDSKLHGAFLNPQLQESNVTLNGDSRLTFDAKGTMNHVMFSMLLNDIEGKQNDIRFHLKEVDLKGESSPFSGETKFKMNTNFLSSVADGKVDLDANLNVKDLNNTLNFESHAVIKAHKKYLNPLLKEQEIRLVKDADLVLDASGGIEDLIVKIAGKGEVLKDKKVVNIHINSSPIRLNLKDHYIEGSVSVKSDGKNMGIDLESKFSGDYTQPQSMKIENKLDVNNFKAFGIDLSTLKPLKVEMKSGKDGFILNLTSKKMNLEAYSKDNNYFTFKLKTGNLYLYKIMKVPPELDHKFVKVDLSGDVTLSKEYFNVVGSIASNKKFKAIIDAHNTQDGLNVKLSTKHLQVHATGDWNNKKVDTVIKIDSLTKVQKEFASVYPFSTIHIDGPLQVTAKMREETISASVISNKLKLEGFNIEKLDLDFVYKENLVTLNKFTFNTTGFKDKNLNQNFYLNQKGLIHLGEKRDILLDMHPNIYVKATGSSENLQGNFKIKKLPLGHPEYGSIVLDCDVNYKQYGLKKKVVGQITLEKLKLFYEAKFLDADSDSDVIIVTKKDKAKQAKRDSFLEDTYVDLIITAPDGHYKTRDIDLAFNVDLKAKKDFGKNLGMLGKIKDINGRVEQAPKLFTVVDSNIVFRGAKEINPLLDIKVNYELPDVLITISIHGNSKRPKLDFSSEPPMPKKDILSYLLLGVSTASLSEGGDSVGREAELFILNQAARDLAYEVELDRVFIKDDGTGEGYAIEVGKKISEDTMFIIENSKEGNSFILEYDLSKSIDVKVGHHQKTIPSQSIDLYFRKRFK